MRVSCFYQLMSANLQISSETAKSYVDYTMSVIQGEKAQTMTSLQIAEITGKRHDAVLRDIRVLLEQGVAAHNFVGSEYKDSTGRNLPCFNLTKKGCLILASGYNALLREKIIDRWELLERDKFSTPNLDELTRARILAAQFVRSELRLNDASYLGLLQQVTAPLGLELPQYVPSQGVLKSASELLKENGYTMSAIKFNMLLVEQGYLETLTRPTSGGAVKKFKSITAKGKPYGENQVSPKNQKETQPQWYADRFGELYNLVTA